jgi:hypothetical protein
MTGHVMTICPDGERHTLLSQDGLLHNALGWIDSACWFANDFEGRGSRLFVEHTAEVFVTCLRCASNPSAKFFPVLPYEARDDA